MRVLAVLLEPALRLAQKGNGGNTKVMNYEDREYEWPRVKLKRNM